ncbi:MAG: hypothetical protein ACOCZL_06580 [Bacteroidota bacterium]
MKLANKKETYHIWLQKFIATVIFTPLVLVVAFSKFFNEPFLGLNRALLIIILSLMYLAVIAYHHLLNPYFIFYTDHGDKLQFRYYPIRAFNSKKNSILIPKHKFVSFKTEKTFLGEKLYLYQQNRKGLAKYPPISLSGLSSKDREDLKTSLNQYLKK